MAWHGMAWHPGKDRQALEMEMEMELEMEGKSRDVKGGGK